MKKLTARIFRSLAWRLSRWANHYEPLNIGSIKDEPITPHALWVKANGDKTLRLDYQLSPDDIVLDVGGYEGQWAGDIFSRYLCIIHIFEPVLHYASMIESRFLKNKNIHLHKVALGKAEDEIEFSIAGDASSSVVLGSQTVNAHMVAFADWCKENNVTKIALMKVNIEGGEYDLLEHLIDTGLIYSIKNLQVQFHDFFPEAEQRMQAIQSQLQKTHSLTYQYKFIWENWAIKGDS